jgi:hypothetical protein
MAINSITVQITDQRIVDGWVAAANRNGTTPEELALEFLKRQGRAYADLLSIGLIPTGAFITRFTPSEYTAILTAAEGSPDLAKLVKQLVAEPRVAFDDPRLEPGLQQLVAADLLAPERVPELLAYERPEALP